NLLLLRNADAADRAAGAGDAERRDRRLLVADTLEDGVGAEAAGELAHTLDCFVAALADDVGCAEVLCERDAVGVPAEDDDLLGAERSEERRVGKECRFGWELCK